MADTIRGKAFGELRAQELGAACRALGVADLVLLDYEDGMLPWVDRGQLEADIRRAIHRFRPDVVITFDEDGLYWHPDHIAVHERTTAAVAAAGVDGPALYYVTMPPGGMRAVVAARAGERWPVEGWIGNHRSASSALPIPMRLARSRRPRRSSSTPRNSPAASWPRSSATARS